MIFGLFTGKYSGLTLYNMYGNLFFLDREPYALSGVMGSMWFMPVYFTVIPLGRFITTKLFSEAGSSPPGRAWFTLFLLGRWFFPYFRKHTILSILFSSRRLLQRHSNKTVQNSFFLFSRYLCDEINRDLF